MFNIKEQKTKQQFVSYNKYLMDQKSKELKRIQKIKMPNFCLKKNTQYKSLENQKNQSQIQIQQSIFSKINQEQQEKKLKDPYKKQTSDYNKLGSNSSFIQHQGQKLENSSASKSRQRIQIQREKDNIKQNWQKIDQKATIVNGKLVYIQGQKPALSDANQLIKVLRSNNIRIKEYIQGDKTKIIGLIEVNYQSKKNQQLQNYINNNMKKSKNVQADCSDWYAKVKDKLFTDYS